MWIYKPLPHFLRKIVGLPGHRRLCGLTWAIEEWLTDDSDGSVRTTAVMAQFSNRVGIGWLETKCRLRANRFSRAITSLAPVALAWLMAAWSCGRELRLPLSRRQPDERDVWRAHGDIRGGCGGSECRRLALCDRDRGRFRHDKSGLSRVLCQLGRTNGEPGGADDHGVEPEQGLPPCSYRGRDGRVAKAEGPGISAGPFFSFERGTVGLRNPCRPCRRPEACRRRRSSSATRRPSPRW